MTTNQLNDLFLRIAEELDISEIHFERAERSYKALGEYIGNHCNYPIDIYTQGSFRLGTVIRPINDEDEYDLDLVCEIANGHTLTAQEIKTGIGEILRNSDRYSSMLEEKKRCWRIEYSDEAQFHMDITPAKPENNSTLSILVTNKNDNGTYSFSSSNPKGYSEWFEKRKRFTGIEKKAIFDSASIEPIKTNKVKLPLQRVVQILKRHRDMMFEKSPDNKPISIIITTLAAQAYNGESGVYDALKKIIETMPQFVLKIGGSYRIPNPSNPNENFADKWNSEPAKAKAFYDWLAKAAKDIITVAPAIIDDYTSLEESLGEGVVGRAISEINPVRHDSALTLIEYNNPNIKTALSVPHRQRVPFKLPRHQMLGITATVTGNGQIYIYKNNGKPIPKNYSIDFNLIVSTTLLKGNYWVWWQVVNTGEEARLSQCLRGGFEREYNSTKRHELTQYTGTHYVQAFLIKRGKCIAMSREFIVNIQ